MKVLVAALAALAVLGPMPVAAQTAYKAEYKLSTVVPAPIPWGVGAERWAELVREKTAGRINIKVYPGVSLVGGDQSREFTALRQGIVDLAVGSTINWSAQVPQLNLFSMPFLVPDQEALGRLLASDVGEEVKRAVSERGVVPLAWGENGSRELTNSRMPIRKPDDLKGMKVRVVGSPIYGDTFTALGANPTQMSWADAQPALATGAVDAQETPLLGYKIFKMHQINQKHVTLWGYVIDPLLFAVSEPVWKTWSPEDQAAVRAAAEQAAAEEIVLSRRSGDESMVKEVEALGTTVTRLSDAEKAAFRDATAGVRQRWRDRIGADLVTRAEAVLAAAR
jgi:tripartite ATP-independent transporter DctP family solute receptor